MTNREPLVLVAGATGLVGGLVARKLVAAGVPVRALERDPEKLAALTVAGAEAMAVDLRDRAAVARACEGVGQIYTSVNNVMGHGASSPNRVDLPAHEALCDAARECGVRRIMYLSFRGGEPESPVDFFRVKHAIEERIRRSGLPYVLLRPSAFMEIWAGMVSDGIRRNGQAILFGNGKPSQISSRSQDVAEFSVRILAASLRAEAELRGRRSARSYELVASSRSTWAFGEAPPDSAACFGGEVAAAAAVDEVAARFMRMGYFTATRDGRLSVWKIAADRFGVSPMSLESFVQSLPPG